MAKAWIVTHPETAYDKAGRVHGNLDPPLTHTGKQKAEKIAKSFVGKPVKRILASPRRRAQQTAKAISKHTGAPVITHDALIPWNLGNLSGAKSKSVKPLLEFFEKRPNKPIPNGEPKGDMLARYKRLFREVRPGDLISAHSQHELALHYAQKGGDPAKVPMFGSDSGKVKEFEV